MTPTLWQLRWRKQLGAHPATAHTTCAKPLVTRSLQAESQTCEPVLLSCQLPRTCASLAPTWLRVALRTQLLFASMRRCFAQSCRVVDGSRPTMPSSSMFAALLHWRWILLVPPDWLIPTLLHGQHNALVRVCRPPLTAEEAQDVFEKLPTKLRTGVQVMGTRDILRDINILTPGPA